MTVEIDQITNVFAILTLEMKNNLFTILFLLIFTKICYTQSINCRLIIELEQPLSKKFDYLQLLDANGKGTEYYIDTIGNKIDSVDLTIDEPEKMILLLCTKDINWNNISPNVKPIWMHEGRYFVCINTENYTLKFEESALNSSMQIESNILDSLRRIKNTYRIEAEYDSLRKGLTYNIFGSNKVTEQYHNKIDSIEKEIAILMYNNFYLQLPNSVLTLYFIQLQTSSKFIDFDKLKYLFDTLNTDFKHYKMYQQCELYFKNKPKTIETIKSLWNPK